VSDTASALCLLCVEMRPEREPAGQGLPRRVWGTVVPRLHEEVRIGFQFWVRKAFSTVRK